MNSFIVTAGVISPLASTLIAVCSVLLVMLLVILFLNQKVLPKNIVVEESEYKMQGLKLDGVKAVVKYTGAGKRGILVVSTPASIPGSAACKASFVLVAVDKRFVRSCDRRVRIVDITSDANKVFVNGYMFVKKNGRFTDITREGLEIDLYTALCCVDLTSEVASLRCTIKAQ